MSKLLATELSDKVMTECLQMFGGYGYMEEYKMARMFRDSRLGPIGGGSSEIMREIISKIVIDDVSYKSSQITDHRSQRTVNREPLTVNDIISSLPLRFKKEKANDIEMKILLRFGNDEEYLINIANSDLSVNNSVNCDPSTVNLIIETDEHTYIGVETGKLNPQEAFMNGKIKVSDLGKMMQFGTLFKKFNN